MSGKDSMWEGAKALFILVGGFLALFIVLALVLLLQGALEMWCDGGSQVACLFAGLMDAVL